MRRATSQYCWPEGQFWQREPIVSGGTTPITKNRSQPGRLQAGSVQ